MATAVAGLAFAAPAGATPYFGFNDGSVLNRQVTPQVSAQLAAGAGANVARTVLSWRDAEKQPGQRVFTIWDSIYNADLARGIRPIFTLMNAPRWALPAGVTCAAGEDCRYAPGPTHDDAWRAMVAEVARRYPQLAALEIWNEPNLKIFWQGTTDPARYADLVKQAYDAAKQVNPSLPILASAGASYRGSDPAVGMSYRSFLTGMYRAGVAGKADGLSVHAYPYDIDLSHFYRMLTEVRDIRDAAGDGATKLWVTETGASTSDYVNTNYLFDLNSQAVMIGTVLERLRAMPDVAATIVHTLINPTVVDASTPERGFGVITPDLVPKPAYCAIAGINGTGFVCPAGVDTVLTTPGIQVLRWRAQDLLQKAVDAARRYRQRAGTYVGLNATALHALSPALSATAASWKALPGATADPSRIAVSVVKNAAGTETLVLCNASQADRSYCVMTKTGAGWTYGKADGSITTAATAIVRGYSQVW